MTNAFIAYLLEQVQNYCDIKTDRDCLVAQAIESYLRGTIHSTRQRWACIRERMRTMLSHEYPRIHAPNQLHNSDYRRREHIEQLVNDLLDILPAIDRMEEVERAIYRLMVAQSTYRHAARSSSKSGESLEASSADKL